MFFLSKINILIRNKILTSLITACSLVLLTHPPVAEATETLSKPNMSNDQILHWANTAVVTIFSYDYSNYKEALQQASTYFTPAAWKQFQEALTKSSNIKIVVENKIKTTVTLLEPTRIMEQGVAFGRYAWKVQIPADLTYTDTKTNSIIKTEHMITTINIIRVPNKINPQGVAIHAINYYYIF